MEVSCASPRGVSSICEPVSKLTTPLCAHKHKKDLGSLRRRHSGSREGAPARAHLAQRGAHRGRPRPQLVEVDGVDVLPLRPSTSLIITVPSGASRRGTQLSITYAIPRAKALRMRTYTRPCSVAPCAEYAVRA